VGAYVAELRVEQAVQALQTTDWSIDAIARVVGYKSEANLYVAVKRRWHVTPGTLRARSRTRTVE
jgi:AraC-like DNA-binding protein